MDKLTLWGWDKKPRTMYRYIKAGDIFCFQYSENIYCFGRIISKLNMGTPAEIFDYISNTPTISKDTIRSVGRMFYPINLGVHTLVDKKLLGDWRIIGRHEDFKPIDADEILFTFGLAPCRKIDVYGNHTIITSEEAEKLQPFWLHSDFHVKELVKSKINKEYIYKEHIPPIKKKTKSKNSALLDKIKPFTLIESASNTSLLLNVGSYKNHLFQIDRGNGYDWSSLATLFLGEKLPHLKKHIRFDPEADMFCAYSENKKAISEFAIAFHTMCEDEILMKELLNRAELD